MLINGMITIQNMDVPYGPPPRPLKSYLLTKKMCAIYYISVKNSKYPNCINYKIKNIIQLHTSCLNSGKMSMKFSEPKHMVSVECKDVEMVKMLLQQIKDIVNGKNLILSHREIPKTLPGKKMIANSFNPACTEFEAVNRFDMRILNMRHLNKLVLEKCILPTLPVQIGHLPIEYLSLSNSQLASSQYDRDTFWDWMTENTICNTLTTLKMDSVGLQTLPFEIMFLRKLKTLSVAKNKLTYLPQYIGELKKLLHLNVANNALNYFPDSLFSRTFYDLDIFNNPFIEFESLIYDHIGTYTMLLHNQHNNRIADKSVVKSLSNLSFNSLMDNCIKFKRQDIPRSLWHYFNVTGRCVQCHKFILPDHSVVRHVVGFPSAKCLTKNHTTDHIRWQSLICRFKCDGPSRRRNF